ncbi:hypothetical protein C8A00DRAFT_34327 [Chaetomidium leptoderma]|uniref:Uncharacterized protein n=1 Tax=Chaetomidium leptoderma TaxID=669021 RepID=A0AAN6ZUZ2_9PEZI|nr:hypothetical protein C8A00DRAFT_34327 [Chaetomidium leptoderma]
MIRVGRLFGPEYYPGAIVETSAHGAALLGDPGDEPGGGDFQLVTSWECNAVTDKATGFDFAAGYWRDMHGAEGRDTPIHAFMEALDFDWVEVYYAFKYYLVRGAWELERLREINPRVLRFDVVEGSGHGGSEQEVVFEVREYTEFMRRCYFNWQVQQTIEAARS